VADVSSRGLGRVDPPDSEHTKQYPMSAVLPETTPQVERELTLPPWHQQHDQGSEGACVGFGTSMALWILNMEESNREKGDFNPQYSYDAWWLWREARLADEWPDNDDLEVSEGTFVRAACDVMRVRGHCLVIDGQTQPEDRSHGILANRWATSSDEVRSAINEGIPCSVGIRWYSNFDEPVDKGGEWWIGEGDLGRVRGGHCVCIYGASDERQAFKIKNSWGTNYPEVYFPYQTLDGEFRDPPEEGGAEVTLFTDR
jgi:hypothetical protein